MGFMSLFMNVGMFISPYASGLVFDQTGSYFYVLAVFTPLYLLSAVAFLFATRPSPPTNSRRRWIGTEAGTPLASPAGGGGN
jgi:nitrate/nitrite transporter NarK